MTTVVLKSSLFGDRSVNVRVSSAVGVPARTGTGTGRSVTITKKSDGDYRVMYDNASRGKSEEIHKKRADALQNAAKFIVKYEPAIS